MPNPAQLRWTLTVTLLPLTLSAQPACIEPTASQLKIEVVVPAGSGLETVGKAGGPVGMAIAPDKRIFIAVMATGQIHVYNPATRQTTVAGTIPTWFDTEDGLLGIVLDRNFASNNWLYASFSDPATSGPSRGMVVARFTVSAANQLTNRKDLLRIPRESSTRHAGGGMDMDGNGVLVIGTGDNTHPFAPNFYAPTNQQNRGWNAERSSSNSNDLRGKILRIKPLPFPDSQTPPVGVGTTYEIPAGNLWEYISDRTFNPGWGTGDDIAKVRKEIFSLGHRNPYHVRVDTRTGWIFWGEVGPDANQENAAAGPAGHDEWNLAKRPGFFGHPYCNGYNRAWGIPVTFGDPYTYSGHYNCTAPVNNSAMNTGIRHLPPSLPALVAYSSGNSTDDDPRFNSSGVGTTPIHDNETAIGGPMYRYDPTLPASSGKLPPYYEGKVCFLEWNRRYVRWITLDEQGRIPAGAAAIRTFAPTGMPRVCWIDAQFGPDGALYLLQYNSTVTYSTVTQSMVYRISYTGTYDDACYRPFGNPVSARPALRRIATPAVPASRFTLPAGYRAVEFHDGGGRLLWSYRRRDAKMESHLQLPDSKAGIWHARLIP